MSKLASALSNFEPATLEHEPDEAKDLLKRLYQYLVPKKIRHDLGEYYTPIGLLNSSFRKSGTMATWINGSLILRVAVALFWYLQ
ncbi:MAG: hypothetical protein JW878_10955 [Methanomicrobia archaeon]|nr:hypothetical protein [Methanomicrobia archaeon]